MVTDIFGLLLQEIGKELEISDLHPDRNNSCLITLKTGISIQLEIDPSSRFIIIGGSIGFIPPGKYRENLFRQALQANDQDPPLHGILAYSKKTDHLILFEKIFIGNIQGESIAREITPFVEKMQIWVEAIKQGNIPTLSQTPQSNRNTFGMFGLRP